MAYWRMQLHPDNSKHALRETIGALSRGAIGLDFHDKAVGDLRSNPITDPSQKNYIGILEMQVGDVVMIQVHHYPFALVEVESDYRFVEDDVRKHLGVWFRHLRFVSSNIRYYADDITPMAEWDRLVMAGTIQRVLKETGPVYQFVHGWAQRA